MSSLPGGPPSPGDTSLGDPLPRGPLPSDLAPVTSALHLERPGFSTVSASPQVSELPGGLCRP